MIVKCIIYSTIPEKKNPVPAQTQCIPVYQSALFSSAQFCGAQFGPTQFSTVPFKLVFISKEVFTPRPRRSQKKFILSVLVHFIFCSIAYRIFVSVGQHYLQLQLSPQLGVDTGTSTMKSQTQVQHILFNWK